MRDGCDDIACACMRFSRLLFRRGVRVEVVSPGAASLARSLYCSAPVRIAAGRKADVMATGGGEDDTDIIKKIGKNIVQNFGTKEVSFYTVTDSP